MIITGTPIQNNLMELFVLYDFVSPVMLLLILCYSCVIERTIEACALFDLVTSSSCFKELHGSSARLDLFRVQQNQQR